MKSTDLRIGNLVNRLGALTSITVISADHISTLLSGAVTLNQIEPIPLTEGWLLKLGFEIINDNPKQKAHYEGDVIFKILDFEFSNSIISATVNERGFYSYEINNGQTILFYVHQLQNLYFALTGNELEVTP